MAVSSRAARIGRLSPLPTGRAPRTGTGSRAAELTGLMLAFAGLALLIALGSYDPHDPSLNTASSRDTHNLVGPLGAVVADLLLQSFGAAAALPGITLLVWAWRLGSRRGMGSVAVRLASLLGAIPAVAAALAALPANSAVNWPTLSGPGGAAGRMLADAALALGARLAGPVGEAFTWIGGTGLAMVLAALALGLTVSEWRSAGHFAKRAAHATARGSRSSWRWMRFGLPVPFRLPKLPPLPFRDRPTPIHPSPIHDEEPIDVPITVSRGYEPLDPIPLPVPIPSGRKVQAPRPPERPRPTNDDRQEKLALDGWRFPSLNLLHPPPQQAQTGPTREALEGNARLLIKVLGDYGVKGTIVEIRPGPVVTMYELEPEAGIRSARVIGLADDVARSLSVTAVRIATVPGRNVIGIEVPNAKRDTVYLSEILSSEEVRKNAGRLPIALGKNISGQAVVADLSRMPHLMIAGTTGSGKSVGVNAMILSLLYRLSPDQCRLILIDPKMLELSIYDGIPHLMAPVVTEPAKAVTALKWVVREMERRYRAMSQLSVRNIGGYNERVEDARRKGEVVNRRVQTGFDSETGRPTFEDQPLALEPLPFIVVVVDEMADLMMVAGKEIEQAVQRLAQMARAAGIHVIMATQRPSVDVITGTIKANFPTRISFQVISKFDSRTILGEQGAEQLLGMGDMLYMQGGGRITRVHGPFVSDEEVERVVAFLREQGEPVYLDEVTEPVDKNDEPLMSGISGANDGEKGLFDQAVDLVAREGKATTSFIQRHLNIGYNRAAKLIEQMEREGMVGPANHVGKREILLRRTNHDDE
ncbi:MAG: DNA translocase FtsK [Acetobacteraceae bacterium]|nr:DNA translocase FtsK [Acetobacteraceae bacterium]